MKTSRQLCENFWTTQTLAMRLLIGWKSFTTACNGIVEDFWHWFDKRIRKLHGVYIGYGNTCASLVDLKTGVCLKRLVPRSHYFDLWKGQLWYHSVAVLSLYWMSDFCRFECQDIWQIYFIQATYQCPFMYCRVLEVWSSKSSDMYNTCPNTGCI